MSNKTISINPLLFSISKSNTKKNRGKTEKKRLPLISPNVLKNKLLKRIKEHKQKELQNLDKKTQDKKKSDENNKDSDEFNESINYLQVLSQQKKMKDSIELRKKDLERKTLRNVYNYQSDPNVSVNIDLPEELKEPLVVIDANNIEYEPVSDNNEPIVLQLPVVKDVPYGVLKNGNKPTYRTWIKTQRNVQCVEVDPKNAISLKTNRLNHLREKIKQKNAEKMLLQQENMFMNTNVIQTSTNNPNTNIIPSSTNTPVIPSTSNDIICVPLNATEAVCATTQSNIAKKKITKRTIKKKYTLGKNKHKNVISVLIKDRATRKNIINAQKELKKKSIDDVKKQLRKSNLIKIGSSAPNDVLRKMYESSMLSGDIMNNNSEIALHNFNKEDV